MVGLLNLGSLLLGLFAWILPIVYLMQNNKNARYNGFFLSGISFSACGISLVFQIFYNYHLVKIEDWSALMDTTRAVAICAAILLIVTIVLNAMALNKFRQQDFS